MFSTPKISIFDSTPVSAETFPTTKIKNVKPEIKIISLKKRNSEQKISKSGKLNSKVYNEKEKINETINLLENENENENGNENEKEILFHKKTKVDHGKVFSEPKNTKNEIKNVNSGKCDKDEWTCMICTFSHRTAQERTYLQCAICSSSRPALSLSASI